MRNLKTIALTAALALALGTSSAWAAESSAGGLELSGHVDIVTGWQHDDNSTIDGGSCVYGAPGPGCNAIDSAGSGVGELGNFRRLGTPGRDTFNFYIDEVELDLQKSFGENIRIRADIDFGRLLSGTPNTGMWNSVLEQAYVTANIPIGNGAEILFGRFNAPIGYESVDRISNTALSFSNIFRYVRPHNLTGLKFYYAFNELFDWSVYLVNNLSDTFSAAAGTESPIPSWGTRFGFTFGEEGQESTLGFSYAGGPENYGQNGKLTHMIDLDFMIRLSESIMIAGEGIYRQDNLGFTNTNGVPFFNVPNSKVFGGNLLLAYSPSETWDFWFRYGYMNDIDPTGAYTSADQQIHDFTIGTSYQITDGAKMKLEYRLDLRKLSAGAAAGANPMALVADGGTTSLSNGVAAEFGYEF